MMPTRACASDVNCRTRSIPSWSGACIRNRGGILFEVMLALALFVGAAAFTLAAVRSVARTLERSRLEQEAVDLARSKLAELEAGVTTLAGLRGESDNVAAEDANASDVDEAAAPPRWRIDVSVGRSEFTDLSLVELTVIEIVPPEVEAAGANPMRYTLRQLVALREGGGKPFEDDAIMRGLQTGTDGR